MFLAQKSIAMVPNGATVKIRVRTTRWGGIGLHGSACGTRTSNEHEDMENGAAVQTVEAAVRGQAADDKANTNGSVRSTVRRGRQ